MKARVVDASVIAAAMFQEQHAASARKILENGETLLAPDLIFSEIANVIWKRFIRNEINANEADQLLEDFLKLPLHIVFSSGLVDSALRLAIQTRSTVYDCLYLALAIREKTEMVSAEQRLANALSAGPLAGFIVSLAKRV
jgi:predicted nucleic acid-binding protein